MRLRWWRKPNEIKDSSEKFDRFNPHNALVRSGRIPGPISRSDMDTAFSFDGVGYSGTATAYSVAKDREGIANDFDGFVRKSFMGNSVVWACEQRRMNVFSEIRFMYRRIEDGRPGELHGSPSTRLNLLIEPWTNATTSDLLNRALLHADFAGNAYIVRYQDQLRLLRPDWVQIVMGSMDDPAVTPDDIAAEVIAYVYFPGGLSRYGEANPPVVLMPDEVAHFAPTPDPIAHFRGLSWLTPLLFELTGDEAANRHKIQFFRNGATLQYVVSLDKDINEDSFNRFVALMQSQTQGLSNAYKTLYLGGGADAKPVGADLKQLDFKAVQGAGETRIAAAAGVPPIIVGLSEGLASATYSNYGQAKRSFVDGTIRPLWRNFCGSMQVLVTPPLGSELFYDDRDIPYLREDEADRAKILQLEMATASAGVMAGWEPDAIIDAISARDLKLLKGHHTGLFSVQLQPPLTEQDLAAGAQRPPLNGRVGGNTNDPNSGTQLEPPNQPPGQPAEQNPPKPAVPKPPGKPKQGGNPNG